MSAPGPARSGRLVLPAYAKLNLGLQLVGKREDGYHELRTVYQTISLHDTLRFEWPSPGFALLVRDGGKPGGGSARGRPHRAGEGAAEVPGGEANLVSRAARLFARASGLEPRVRVILSKRIPAGAGLGGGSSDAATTLIALNRLHGAPLPASRLQELAAGLGSDVPFFLAGGTALGLGRGEIVRPLRDFGDSAVLVVIPDFRVSTAEAYGRVGRILTPERGQISIYRFCRQGVRETGRHPILQNDLERAVLPAHPEIGRLVRRLRAAGAAAAAMTGSGSAVFGIFAGRKGASRAFRDLTGSSQVARAWLGRTVGAAEYSTRVLKGGAASPRL